MPPRGEAAAEADCAWRGDGAPALITEPDAEPEPLSCASTEPEAGAADFHCYPVLAAIGPFFWPLNAN